MSLFQIALAHAESAPAAAQQPAPGGIAMLLQSPLTMLIIIFGIFYFLIIRPQQKKQKELAEMMKKLDKGDQVVTTGGIYGTILAVNGDVLTVQVDDKVKIRVARHAIAGPAKIE
jgi:preprotein translocase subunit YajC